MGIDRFLACQCPILYRLLCSKRTFYLAIQLTFPIIFTVYINTFSFLQRDPNTLVICQVPLAISGDTFEKFNKWGLIINMGVVFIYFITYRKLRNQTALTSGLKFIFKSILYTVIFVILGWCTVTIVNIASIHLVEDFGVSNCNSKAVRNEECIHNAYEFGRC
ncbi:hypothetical protein B9Z55_020704 [Caenorhabditis nigoni]|uniref:G-protein coupled receptors family 1 profile domain-containing protein n=1 Tax=Caenorhabditis nigoni TaxID=1611254 RepID=A0A2G5TNU3_9PELO|nr:hypothetical protein B9Z55_020704 [Caenorhabditis nigoni]